MKTSAALCVSFLLGFILASSLLSMLCIFAVIVYMTEFLRPTPMDPS